jgi:hypothetical protein
MAMWSHLCSVYCVEKTRGYQGSGRSYWRDLVCGGAVVSTRTRCKAHGGVCSPEKAARESERGNRENEEVEGGVA